MIDYFDRIYYIRRSELSGDQVEKKRQRFFKSIQHFYPTCRPLIVDAHLTVGQPGGSHVGCALSWLDVIRHAKVASYARILVFEEDALLLKNFGRLFDNVIGELKTNHWDLLKLGAGVWQTIDPGWEKYNDCEHLQIEDGTCTHAMALNHTIYDRFLNEYPETEQGVREYVLDPGYNAGAAYNGAIDMFILYHIKKPHWTKLITKPRLVTQDSLSGLSVGFKQDYRWDYHYPDGVDDVNGYKIGDQETRTDWVPYEK